jgi:hypothetical protein
MRRVAALSILLLFVPLTMSAETCPKVTYTNMASTLKDLVAVVNCLASSNEQTNTAKAPSASKAMQAESFQIVGPQHSRPYPNLVMVLLTVPTGRRAEERRSYARDQGSQRDGGNGRIVFREDQPRQDGR